ncbi:D-alanyl-D-alanine carboxypeptidase [Candidatus Enterococcus mansonii]|uniref:D-alanyl-D-alanine carboxypeptidase n=1 Tax=Candidatus Enterococcus mansonii TaxID=1834181 RepID=UPI000A33A312|nr:D-alanyl-D-alanine carboxypeptidase [Enterococcus sp. 4G2_DIV0659]
MKKRTILPKICSLLLFIGYFSGLYTSSSAYAQEDILTLTQNAGYQTSEAYTPKSSIVISADTGQVLWEDNPDLKWNPASIAKLLSSYLVFEALEKGQFTLDTTVKATDSDEAISQIYELSNNTIVAGVDYPVRDLLYATLVQSSNVATIMLANLVTAKDEAKFIHMMNDKAKELGMTNSTFYNSSGAETGSFNGYYKPEGIDQNADNVSTARDLALLSYHLLKNYPETTTYTSPTQITIMENTPYAEVLVNHNYSLPGLIYGYEGVDGLKTGSSPTGGFNYAATAKRADTRLIEVVLGVGDWEDQDGEAQRHAFGNALFDKAFATYEYKKLLSKGDNTVNNEAIILERDFYGLIQKNTEPAFTLTAGSISVDSDLSQVSSTIKTPSTEFTYAKKFKALQNAHFLKNGKKKNSLSTFFINGLLIVLGLLFVALARLFKKEPTKENPSKRFNPLLTLGALLIIAGICLSIYTLVVGPWI